MSEQHNPDGINLAPMMRRLRRNTSWKGPPRHVVAFPVGSRVSVPWGIRTRMRPDLPSRMGTVIGHSAKMVRIELDMDPNWQWAGETLQPPCILVLERLTPTRP